MFKRLAKKIKNNNIEKLHQGVTLPFGNVFLTDDNTYMKNISKSALDIYERQADIDKFTKIVLSDPENNSQEDLVSDLFNNHGAADALDDFKLEQLADNKKFLRDLGLL